MAKKKEKKRKKIRGHKKKGNGLERVARKTRGGVCDKQTDALLVRVNRH